MAEPKSTVGKHTLRIDITLSSPDAAANGRNLWFEVTAEEDGDVSTFLREEIKKQLVPVVETGIKALEKDIKAGPPKAPLKVLAKAYNKSIYITKRRNSIP